MKTEVLVDPASLPQSTGTGIPIKPGLILGSPGYVVGTTHHDYQTSGSTGNRIVKDVLGNIHVCWMNGIGSWSGNRWIYYNFRDATSGIWSWGSTGTQVNLPPQGDGYTNMDVLSGGEEVITYHSLADQDWSVISVDSIAGFGSFTEYNVPDRIPDDTVAIWPYVAVDRQDRIHIVAHAYYTFAGATHSVIYTRSGDQGVSWTEPVVFDTTRSLSCIIVASSVDDKVAIVYAQPGQHPDAYCDIIYVESPDGVTWDWTSKRNVTVYDTSCYKDSIWAFADNDAVYDNDGNLHIVWNAVKTISGGGALAQAFLFHWSEATGINFIAKHPEEPSWPPNCEWGGWNWALAKMSIGVDADNRLFCIFTRFNPDDCSVGGYANGEIYMSYSADGGATWAEMVNLTNSPSPDCWPAECESDHWSSLAETVDDSLYILYINDKDAGGIPQVEGVDTENPVMYLAVPKPTGEVTMTCEALTPVFCRGKNFYFKLLFDNSTGVNVSGALTFSSYSGYGCDPGNLMDNLTRSKTFGPGTTETYYYLMAPYDEYPPGQYSASVSGTIAGFELFCCMNGDIVQCEPWKVGDNTEWGLVEIHRPDFEVPTVTSLAQNYPNPFNANTNISYTLAEAGNVSLNVYDISGRLVTTLADGYQESGEHTASWDASEVSSGVYFYKLTTADCTATKKMHLLK